MALLNIYVFYFVWALALDSFSKYERAQVLDHKFRMWMIFLKNDQGVLHSGCVVWNSSRRESEFQVFCIPASTGLPVSVLDLGHFSTCMIHFIIVLILELPDDI